MYSLLGCDWTHFAGRLVGIGIGTLLAVLGVGRAVALFNLLLKNKMLRAAGLEKK